jgi:DNA-binding NtrC family response regulator
LAGILFGGMKGANQINMDTILIVDVDPERADLICRLLIENSVPARRCQDIQEIRRAIEEDHRPAVIVAHCALVNYSFTELALLRHHPQVKLIFYCTDADQKSVGSVAKLPEELTEILLKITEGKKVQTKAS